MAQRRLRALGDGLCVATAGAAAVAAVAAYPQAGYLRWLPVFLVVLVGAGLFRTVLQKAMALRARQVHASMALSIAHEMREPLAQLQDTLAQMKEALSDLPATRAGTPAGRTHALLEQASRSASRALQVVAMTVDEVEARQPQRAAFTYLRAAAVCLKAVAEYAYESEPQRDSVSLEVEADFCFHAEETAFLFVLFNLLKNALYYLPLHPRSRIVVTVRAPRILVRDEGPGIHPERLARLFEPFRAQGKPDGAGLGLAYCARAVRSFGGSIACESELGLYTQFTLQFPEATEEVVQAFETRAFMQRHRFTRKRLAQADAPYEAGHESAPGLGVRGLKGRVVIVADDCGLDRRNMVTHLRHAGVSVIEATHGREVLECLQAAGGADAVLMAQQMPGMSAAETLRAIRASRLPWAGVPVLTLVKPMEPRALLEALAGVMKPRPLIRR